MTTHKENSMSRKFLNTYNFYQTKEKYQLKKKLFQKVEDVLNSFHEGNITLISTRHWHHRRRKLKTNISYKYRCKKP